MSVADAAEIILGDIEHTRKATSALCEQFPNHSRRQRFCQLLLDRIEAAPRVLSKRLLCDWGQISKGEDLKRILSVHEYFVYVRRHLISILECELRLEHDSVLSCDASTKLLVLETKLTMIMEESLRWERRRAIPGHFVLSHSSGSARSENKRHHDGTSLDLHVSRENDRTGISGALLGAERGAVAATSTRSVTAIGGEGSSRENQEDRARYDYHRGLTHQNRQGAPQDLLFPPNMFKMAADIGHAEAALQLGIAFEYGTGLQRSVQEALRYYEIASSLGSSWASFNIARISADRAGFFLNYDLAHSFYKLAGDSGISIAYCELGRLHLGGYGVDKSPQEAAKWFNLAGASGYTTGYYNAGIALSSIDDGKGAVDAFLAAALAGHAGALNMIADRTRTGSPEFEGRIAAMFYCLAAARGCPEATFSVGTMYSGGEGVLLDPIKATSLFIRAANMGHAEAQVRAAEAFRNGEGVFKDSLAAVRWYTSAAYQGYRLSYDALEYIQMNSRMDMQNGSMDLGMAFEPIGLARF